MSSCVVLLQIHGAESELSSLLRLQHPHLVHYQALSSRERDDCLVVDLLLEHVGGTSLSQSLASQTPVPLAQLRQHTAQILSALDYLHTSSVVHKALGPSSVLLDARGDVRLTDYSLSRRLADICREDVFEQAHVRFCEGTLPSKTGKKGDVWSLGLMLLGLAQGREVKECPAPLPDSLPPDFQDFLNRWVMCSLLGERGAVLRGRARHQHIFHGCIRLAWLVTNNIQKNKRFYTLIH